MTPVTLSSELIESFGGVYLSPRYDKPRPIAGFHVEAWGLYAGDDPEVMVIAPRDHAKSTALTFVYGLAEALFRSSDYIIVIGSTEEMAQEQLSNISEELHENGELNRDFGPFVFETDQKTELVVRCPDGYRFRFLARGAEQRIRGRLWKGKRPNLLICDDMEDDEQVESVDRRRKFRKWFFRAAKQALSKDGKIRVHGTILHEDSLLSRLRKNSTWKHLFYKAHAGFDDFSHILWPERWSERDLRKKRQEFLDDGDAAGYSQEFLNDPQDSSDAYLRRDDFIEMSERDFDTPKRIYVGCDFAVSKADSGNRTSFTIGGPDINNLVHHLDFHVGRWSSTVSAEERRKGEFGWIDLMFDIQRRWEPEVFFVEGGQIWLSVEKLLYEEMRLRDNYLNIVVLKPIKDKASRGRAFQKRHRAGATRWNTEAEGYEDAREEMLRFTGVAAARLDDQFDSCATLHIGLSQESSVEEEDFLDEEEFLKRYSKPPGGEQASVIEGGFTGYNR